MFDVIFWIMILGSVTVAIFKGLFWFSIAKNIFSGLGAFTNPYGAARAAPEKQSNGLDKLMLILTVLGLIIGICGLIK